MNGAIIQSINPNTGEHLGSVPIFDTAAVRQAVHRSRIAQKNWAEVPLKDRIQVLKRIQEALVDHADEIAELVSKESGKTLAEALFEDVFLVLQNLSDYLNLAPSFLSPHRLRPGILQWNKRFYVTQVPLGVIGVISPFNFPILLAMKAVFPALLSGNAVVQKPSERTPLSAVLVQDIFNAAGLPAYLYQIISGEARTGADLIDSGIDHIYFVGSSQIGRQVARQAGERLISTTLELGGNNAMLILEDAPLARAADAAVTYAFGNNGQMCGAISRIFVHETCREPFLAILKSRMKTIRTNTDTSPGRGEVTAVIDAAALDRVEQFVQSAFQENAKVLHGGHRLPGTPAPIYRPTVLLDEGEDQLLNAEEIFGPVITIRTTRDTNEAIKLTNDTPYGLTASVWTMDEEKGKEVARQLRVGSVAVNDHLLPFFATDSPWGGVKASGLGQIGGTWGLQSMTTPKVICVDRLNLKREFYWFPTTEKIYQIIRLGIPTLYSSRPMKRLKGLLTIISLFIKNK